MGNFVEGLVYNKKVFADAGVSVPIKTVTEFFEACKKIKAKGKIPFYVNFGSHWPLQQYDKYPLVIAGDANVCEDMLNQDKAFSGDTAYHKSLSFLKKVITDGLQREGSDDQLLGGLQEHLRQGQCRHVLPGQLDHPPV